MKIACSSLILLAVGAPVASAAPGDPVAMQGTLAWPQALAGEPFLVMRGQDGRAYYVDVSSAQRAAGPALTAGSAMSVVGVEGQKPHEVAAVAVGPGDSVVASLPPARPDPAALPSAVAATPAPAPPAAAPRPAEPERPWQRLEGNIRSVSAGEITLETEGGRTARVNVSKLGANVLDGLRSGDRVTLFVVEEADRTLNAVGLVHSTARPAPPRAP
jgi:hypothetical protein